MSIFKTENSALNSDFVIRMAYDVFIRTVITYPIFYIFHTCTPLQFSFLSLLGLLICIGTFYFMSFVSRFSQTESLQTPLVRVNLQVLGHQAMVVTYNHELITGILKLANHECRHLPAPYRSTRCHMYLRTSQNTG